MFSLLRVTLLFKTDLCNKHEIFWFPMTHESPAAPAACTLLAPFTSILVTICPVLLHNIELEV